MKILVISLLRAGDLVMQRPLLAALKESSPGVQLHLILNDEVSWIAPVLKEADQIHIFPRKTLQRLMGENDHHIARASVEVSGFLQTLNQYQFDQVLNLTHNRLSAYIAEEISAPIKKGLHTEGPRFQGLENPWLKLFNDRFSGTIPFPFHYSEILAKAFDLKIKSSMVPQKNSIRRIFLQVLTSDAKKNWSLLNFRNLLDNLYGDYPEVEFKILASEKEAVGLTKYFQAEELCTWDMQTLEKEFNSSDLLITGDTVTLHLAAQRSAQILEIALGSSDPWKTGPFAANHYILTSKAACYPCVHSNPCRQLSQLCSTPITPKTVESVVHSLMHGENPLASFSMNSGSVRLYRTQVKDYGFELVDASGETDLRILNKILWQKIFNPTFDISILRKLNFGLSFQALHDLQCELKETLYYLQADFEDRVKKLGATQLNLFDVQESRRKLGSIQSSPGNEEWTWMLMDLSKLSFSSPLHFLSAYQDRLEILKGAIYFRDEMTNPHDENRNEREA